MATLLISKPINSRRYIRYKRDFFSEIPCIMFAIHQLKRVVSRTVIEIYYCKSKRKTCKENIEIMGDFLSITRALFCPFDFLQLNHIRKEKTIKTTIKHYTKDYFFKMCILFNRNHDGFITKNELHQTTKKLTEKQVKKKL